MSASATSTLAPEAARNSTRLPAGPPSAAGVTASTRRRPGGRPGKHVRAKRRHGRAGVERDARERLAAEHRAGHDQRAVHDLEGGGVRGERHVEERGHPWRKVGPERAGREQHGAVPAGRHHVMHDARVPLGLVLRQLVASATRITSAPPAPSDAHAAPRPGPPTASAWALPPSSRANLAAAPTTSWAVARMPPSRCSANAPPHPHRSPSPPPSRIRTP